MRASNHHYLVFIAITVCVCVGWSSSFAGEFDVIRERIRTDKPKPKKQDDDDDDDDDHHHHGWHDDDDDDDGINLFAIFSFFSSDDDHHHRHYHPHGHDVYYELDEYDQVFDKQAKTGPEMLFTHYPYAHGHNGYMMHSDFMTAPPQTSSSRVEFQFGGDFDDVKRYTGKALFEASSRWGLDAEWNYYTEWIRPGVQDNFHVGDINLLYRFIQTPNSIWRLGLGLNWFESGIVDETGLNATLRVDYFPRPPVIFSGELEYGGLGDSEMLHGGFTLGLNWRHVEVFTGYDYRRIAGVELQGPLFGVRLWW